ncbi:hypothetical protein EYC80_008999 [Monilinia laxa]|uniref:DUF7053 domain-containing protein n=1 Tax=Monilinia laxa TaxID=61186 RepID=A0A5N6K231_MONLA|nr:hypothetical protein EYC80_008999 [Monilinia laxa]
MSFLTTTHQTLTLTPVPPHIPISQVLALLHNHEKMISMNPLVTAHTLLPPTHILAVDFFKTEPADLQPTASSPCEVWEVTDDMAAANVEESGGGWRGGWAKRFIPDQITYLSCFQDREDGLLSVTHAPMGSTQCDDLDCEGSGAWGEFSDAGIGGKIGFGGEGGGEGDHEKLVRDFMKVLKEKEINGGEAENPQGESGEL